MSIYGEYYVPTETFALNHTFTELPETIIETERIVATDEVLTPYFWVSTEDNETFETVVEKDPSIQNFHRLDDLDESTLYRGEWTKNVEAIAYAYTELGVTILEACGQHDEWRLKIRFDNHDQLLQFRDYCTEQEMSYRLTKLYEITESKTARMYGLTPKQRDALVTAVEMGYFTSSNVTLSDIADELDISQQSVTERLHRGHQTLIQNTLIVTSP